MAIAVATKGKYKIITIDKDVTDSPALSAVNDTVHDLLLLGDKHFVFDLSGVTLIDSRFIGVIGDMYRKVDLRGGTLNVIVPNKDVADVFDLSGLNNVIKVYRNLEQLFKIRKELETERLQHLQKGSSKNLDVLVCGEFKIVKVKRDMGQLAAAREFNKLITEFIESGAVKFVFDFSRINSLTSIMLGYIVSCYEKVQRKRGEIFILAESDEIQEVFNLSGLRDLISISKDTKHFYKKIESQGETAGSRKIIIASRSSLVRKSLLKILGDLGYEALTTSGAKESMEAVRVRKPDLIIMDNDLGDMNGFNACKEIKKELGDVFIPIILLTVSKRPKERLQVLEADGDDFLEKPVKQNELMFRIKVQLRIKDLTERFSRINKHMEKLVEEKTSSHIESERQLYQAEKLSVVSTMLSGIAHELKNPLFIIGSYAQIISRDTTLSEKVKKNIGYIIDQSAKCNTIVENMLGLVRKKVIDLSHVDINELVSGLLPNIKYIGFNKNIEVLTELGAKGIIKGNYAELEQVVTYLVSNSIDAIERDGTVTIKTRDYEGNCNLEITDTGCGIPEKVRRRMFDPFFTTKDTGKGTGLGLSIVYKTVQAHRGKISLKSEVGSGTTFTISFPRVENGFM
jgi:anti-anti-sigma factor